MQKKTISGQTKEKWVERMIKTLLVNRGLKTKKEQEEFLKPRDPLKISYGETGIAGKELEKAILRIKRAIDSQEGILVYGDYDADGICGTAIVWEVLRDQGARVWPFIPDRGKHGYGLSVKGFKEASEELRKGLGCGVGLVITVDNGIAANRAIGSLNAKGVETIIVDHHEAGEKLPRAAAIAHTKKLAGAGAAWFLARELGAVETMSRELLSLAAIGTICDLMPLLGVNRSLVKYGLGELSKTKRAGLRVLFRQAGIKSQALKSFLKPGFKGEWQVGTYEVGYIVGPRLNAAGRLEQAMDSLRLLCTKDKQRAEELAGVLGEINKLRQEMTQDLSVQAQDRVRAGKKLKKLIFVGHEEYHEGVIGLIASSLVERFYRPAIVFAKGEFLSKASARSIPGFNMIEAIQKAGQGILTHAGGHKMAAGFTVKTGDLEILQKRLEAMAEEKIEEKQLIKTLKVDLEIELSDISWSLYKRIQEFQPFGIGNFEPVFATRKVKILRVRQMGRTAKHLKLELEGAIEAIAFGKGELYNQLSKSKETDIAYSLLANDWGGQERLQLKVKDFKR